MLKKDVYSYGIIYSNKKGKKEAIDEIEGICPNCGNFKNLKKKKIIY